jgi:hypothetical protein
MFLKSLSFRLQSHQLGPPGTAIVCQDSHGGVAERLKAPVLKTYATGYGGVRPVTPPANTLAFGRSRLPRVTPYAHKVGSKWALKASTTHCRGFSNRRLERRNSVACSY